MSDRANTKSAITDEAGFTLIELVLVIAFLGILAAIALLGSGGFRERARDLCHSNNDRMAWTVDQAQTITSFPYEAHYDVGPGDCDAAGPDSNRVFLAPSRPVFLLHARPEIA